MVVHLTDCLGACTVFNKKRGVASFVLLQRVSGGGDLLSIGSKGWKFPTLCYNVPDILLGVVD